MDSCSFCAAVAWKLLCLPWACLPESVRAHCLVVASFCSHCYHTALITSLLCLEHLITATTVCLGWLQDLTWLSSGVQKVHAPLSFPEWPPWEMEAKITDWRISMEICGQFAGLVHRPQEWHLRVRAKDGVVVVKVVLDSVPPEHEVNGMEQRADNVLLWTGVELIFSTAGGMGLRFGFALITVSILQVVLLLLRSTCLHNTNAFSASHIKNGNVLMLTC